MQTMEGRRSSSKALCVFFFFLLLLVVEGCACEHHHSRSRSRSYGVAERVGPPTEAQTVLETDGGRILKWTTAPPHHEEEAAAAAEEETEEEEEGLEEELVVGRMETRKVVLNPKSLLLPQYANSHRLLLVLHAGRSTSPHSSSCRMGLLLPMGLKANVRSVEAGEMVAIPRGMPFWMYNHHSEEPCTFLTFANIREAISYGCRTYEAFHLAGSTHDEMGGILHGFSIDMLSAAMDLDPRKVSELVDAQQGVALVSTRHEHEPRLRSPSFNVVGEGEDVEEEEECEEYSTTRTLTAEFAYKFHEAHRDIVHPNVGHLVVANSFKLPILKLVGMSVSCLHLEPGAMLAPGWLTNADHSIYCRRGSAQVQVTKPNGEMACDVEMKEGTMMTIPSNYPFMYQACPNNGFDAILVMNNDRHISMHISGEDSVFSFMPSRVTTTSFDIDDKLDSQLRHRSRRFMTLVPPMQSTHEGRQRHSTHEGQLGSTSSQNRQKFPSIVEPLDHEVRDILWSMFV